MRYMFKILFLGDPNITNVYVTNALQEQGEDMGTYIEWYKEMHVFDDVCDLEINTITDMISADFDEIIPMVDGIIYMINPKNKQEYEFFEMILPIIQSVRRDIPTILLFYDPNGIIPISVNKLLESVWLEHSDMEAFANIPPNNLHEVIQCLCLAMINGDTPLYIENAWMRFPLYIQQANQFYSHGNYYQAAQAIRKAAMISDIFNREDFFIYSEQSAYAFARSNLYLEASNILEKVDRHKAKNFKKLYAEAMIREGNRLFNRKEFETAARQYEMAAQWSTIELKDNIMIQEAFRLAINSWVSACKVQNAFNILERLPHEESQKILGELTDKIVLAANFLASQENYLAAKEQLYKSINTYQKEALFDDIQKFAKKLVYILLDIFKNQIKDDDLYGAKQSFDEIENLLETFELEPINLDTPLKGLITKFIDQLNFGMASILINKLNSLEIKQQLTRLSSEVEDKNKDNIRKKAEENLQRGLDIIQDFMKEELDIIASQNKDYLERAEKLIKEDNHLKAASLIKEQHQFLKQMGIENIACQMLQRSAEVLVKGLYFGKFFENFSQILDENKKDFLSRTYSLFLERLEIFGLNAEFDEIKEIFEKSTKIFRAQMLYEKSKTIAELYIQFIKREALNLVSEQNDHEGIKNALELVKLANNTASSYLEKTKLTFDRLYKTIAEIYLNFGDYSSAQAFTDRIENKEFYTEIHKKLAKAEDEKSAIAAQKAEESVKSELLKEKLSIIKKKARDASHDKDNELRQRKGLRRAYFKDALEFLQNSEIHNASEKYLDSVKRLNRIKKYNLAGVSLAVSSLLLMKEGNYPLLQEKLEELKKECGSIFSETFPIKLIEYILDMKNLGDDDKLKEAISYFEKLPLFPQEIEVLYELIGRDYKKVEKIEKVEDQTSKQVKIRSKIQKYGTKISYEKQDISKRKLMKRQYWKEPLKDLASKQFLNASIGYLDAVEKLVHKEFLIHGAIGLVIGTLTLSKAKDVKVAHETFKQNVIKLQKEQSGFQELPEIKIMAQIILAFEKNYDSIVSEGIKILIDKLILFDEEKDFLETFTGVVLEEEEGEVTLSRKERGELSKLKVKMDQIMASLKQQFGDIKNESQRFFMKRKAMRRRYYNEILELLKSKQYSDAAMKYFELVQNLHSRKDYQTSSFLLTLYGFTLLKAGVTFTEVKSKIDTYLNSLGRNKNFIEDTFYLTFLDLYLDSVINEMESYLPKLRKIYRNLPLFEEEKKLV